MGRYTAALLLCFAFAAGSKAAPCFDTPGPCAAAAGLALPAPALPEAEALAAARPVVISIVGVDFTEVGLGKLELAYFKKILEHFKPGHRLNEELFSYDISAVNKDLASGEYYKLPGYDQKLPDDYLDARLAEALPGEKFEIVPVRWSRDPDESEAAVPLVEKEIKRIFAKARSEGRPVYLVAHSWGTVLAHAALHRLAASAPEVRVEKLVTLGSPLVPGSWWLNIFMQHEINIGHLQEYVAKPRNTGRWVNLWAKNDYFSNEIAAADKNILEDDLTVALERRVKWAAQIDHSLRDEALRDLFFLKSLKTWHFAYIFDFEVYLKTLKESHGKAIFEPVISAELAY